MPAAVKSRGRVLIAISSVAILLLALLFAFREVQDRPSSASSGAGVPAADDIASTHVTKPPVDAARPGIASDVPVVEQAPLTSSTYVENDLRRETDPGAGNLTPVADSPADKRPPPRPGTIAAECWGLRGSAPRDFIVTLDREVRTSGEASALISAQRESAGYVTMFQTSAAAPLRGRRVEFSADIRTRGATGSANLLLRAEDEHGRTVAFDNMQTYGADGRPDQIDNHGVTGNSEWSTQHVVVDIPDSAHVITYGVSVFRGGKAWIDNARIEAVTNDMAITGLPVSVWPIPPNNMPANPPRLARPRNLEFDLEARADTAPCN